MEKAKQLREERKNGMSQKDAAEATFTPQVNKRPSYLNDRKDSLDNEVQIRSDDIFEQPLPGNRPKPQVYDAYQGLPSPGSDALGREMKKHPSSDNYSNQNYNNNNGYNNASYGNDKVSDAQYKSQFLQQYETEKRNKMEKAKQQQMQQEQMQRNQYQNDDDNDAFFNQLRSDNNKSSGPGWNNDTTTNGFASKKSNVPPKQVAPRQRHGTPPEYSASSNPRPISNSNDLPASAAQRNSSIPSRHQKPAPEWNNDTDASRMYDMPPPRVTPTKVSPRPSAIPQLKLLKSKIRSSDASSGASRASLGGMSRSSSSGQPMGGVGNDEYSPPGAGAGGRKTAPNYGNYPEQEDEYAPKVVVRGGRRAPQLQQQQQPVEPQYSQPPSQRQQQQDFGYQPSFSSNTGPPARQAPVRVDVGETDNNNSKPQYNSRWDDDEPQQERKAIVPPHIARRQAAAAAQQQSQPPPQQQQQQQAPVRNSQSNFQQPQQQQQQYQPPVRQQQAPPPQQQQQQYQQSRPAPAAAPSMMSEYPDPSPYPEESVGEQMECPTCGRKFNPAPYEKHIKICAKVFVQKRKAFDSAAMRIEAIAETAPDAVQILTKAQKEEKKKAALEAKKAKAKAKPDPVEQPLNNATAGGGDNAKWKAESNAFREAMKAARQYSQAVASGKTPPPPVISSAPDPSLIQCPHCSRRFNEKAAERHIPQCQNIINKPKTLARGKGGGGGVNGAPAAAAKAAAKGRR